MQSQLSSEDDAYATVFGKEHPGRVELWAKVSAHHKCMDQLVMLEKVRLVIIFSKLSLMPIWRR